MDKLGSIEKFMEIDFPVTTQERKKLCIYKRMYEKADRTALIRALLRLDLQVMRMINGYENKDA